jgi:hypothetical protein
LNASHGLIEYGPRFMTAEKMLRLAGPEAGPQVKHPGYNDERSGDALCGSPQRPQRNPRQLV